MYYVEMMRESLSNEMLNAIGSLFLYSKMTDESWWLMTLNCYWMINIFRQTFNLFLVSSGFFIFIYL
jgi:hypothetical protein